MTTIRSVHVNPPPHHTSKYRSAQYTPPGRLHDNLVTIILRGRFDDGIDDVSFGDYDIVFSGDGRCVRTSIMAKSQNRCRPN